MLVINPEISSVFSDIVKDGYQKCNALWPISQNITFTTNKGRTRNGYCRKIDSNNYIIAINQDIVQSKDILNVVVHELLHSYPDVFTQGHKGEWKQRATMINNVYGLNIQRCNTYQRAKTYSKRSIKYLVHCTKCHHEWNYRRTPKWINHVEKVTCPFCHTHTIQADTVVSIDTYKL